MMKRQMAVTGSPMVRILTTTKVFRAVSFTTNFFIALACYWPELDGFIQHFQATVHFPLRCAVD